MTTRFNNIPVNAVAIPTALPNRAGGPRRAAGLKTIIHTVATKTSVNSIPLQKTSANPTLTIREDSILAPNRGLAFPLPTSTMESDTSTLSSNRLPLRHHTISRSRVPSVEWDERKRVPMWIIS
jgi:hypothetical protein